MLADGNARDVSVVAGQRHQESAERDVSCHFLARAVVELVDLCSGGLHRCSVSLLPVWPGRLDGARRQAARERPFFGLTFPYMTYSQSSASPPSISARHPPAEAAPSLPAPSGLRVVARARLKLESVGRSIRSVLICRHLGLSTSPPQAVCESKRLTSRVSRISWLFDLAATRDTTDGNGSD